MQIILLRDIKGLGRKGEVKAVSDGYARNFLFPQKTAILADDKSLRNKTLRKMTEEAQAARKIKTAAELKKSLEGFVLEFSAKASASGKLFGSITKEDIAEKLRGRGVEIGKKKILLTEPIKSVGNHRVETELAPDAKVAITVRVAEKK